MNDMEKKHEMGKGPVSSGSGLVFLTPNKKSFFLLISL